jgi:hypothetical protein
LLYGGTYIGALSGAARRAGHLAGGVLVHDAAEVAAAARAEGKRHIK